MKLTLVFLVAVVTGCLAGSHPSQRRRNFWEQRNSFQDETNDVAIPKGYFKNNELFLERKELDDLFPREPKTTTMETTASKTIAPVTLKPTTTELNVSAEKAQQLFGISKFGINAIWVFNGDWSETVLGDFFSGTSVLIIYDASRLPGRDKRYGQRAWSISVEYMFDYGKVHSKELEGPKIIGGKEIMATKIFLRFDVSKLTVWFKHWGYYSGYSYDSDYGKNYEHEIVEPKEATLVFGDHGESKYGGPLEQGGEFQVYYSDRRLDVGDGFKLYAAAQFKANSEEYETHEVTDFLKYYYITDFHIPEDAEEVIMWFYTEKGDERHYDSNFGANYHFPLGI